MFNPKEFDHIRAALPGIVKRAAIVRSKVVEPVRSERDVVRALICQFIASRKRIVYGGMALNAHLMAATQGRTYIYEEDAEPDMEFYSFLAMQDVVDLCDALHHAGFKNVEAKLAMHDDTYTIMVNFQKYCDITYMPKAIFHSIPVVAVDGMIYVHPHFSAIDYFRILCDPWSSYFRLEKDLPRLQLLLETFPIPPVDVSAPRCMPVSPDEAVLQVLETRLDRIVFVGELAYANACKRHCVPLEPGEETVPIEFYTTSFVTDVTDILSALGDSASYDEHHRFYDFWNHRGVIRNRGRVVAIAYDAGMRAVPFVREGTMRFATFSFNVCHYMICKTWYDVAKNQAQALRCGQVVCDLLALRRSVSDKDDATFENDAVFKEFVMDDFIGTPHNLMHIKGARMRVRERRRRPIVVKYRPTQKNKEFMNDFSFDNTSGNIINSYRDRLVRWGEPIENILTP